MKLLAPVNLALARNAGTRLSARALASLADRRIIAYMSLREFLRTRRQRRARKRHNREKALRDSQNDEKAIDRVADGAKTLSGGLG